MGKGVSGDYIRTYLGLMGSGKTTQALRDVQGAARVIIYSPGSSNPLMGQYPFIYDTPDYLKNFTRYLGIYPRVRVEKRAFPSTFFREMSRVRGYAIVLDDLAALKTSGHEKNDFDAFIRTVRFNDNRVILTTHRARGDISPLVRNIGTSFYYVGPGVRSPWELKTLYELTNYPISYEEFCSKLQNNPPRNGTKSAGVFKIRGA